MTTERIITLWNDFCDENDLYFERLRTEEECFDELEIWCGGADFGTIFEAVTNFNASFDGVRGDYFTLTDYTNMPECSEGILKDEDEVKEYIDGTGRTEEFQEYIEQHID